MPESIDGKRKFATGFDTEYDQRDCWKKRGCNRSHADAFNEALLTGEQFATLIVRARPDHAPRRKVCAMRRRVPP